MAGFIPDKTTHLAVAVASAATTATWAAGERLSIVSSTNCWVLTGTAPTAAASTGVYVQAGVPMVIQISVNASKIAAIRATADGDLTISAAVGD
jgi:hypothetical protein